MDLMGHASTRAALIYLRAREERDREIADGIEQMVRKANRNAGVRRPKWPANDVQRRVQMQLTCGGGVERVTGIEPA